ncbi:hypothetical protein BDN70DRAFT_922249 [Pholiota conissans]|uniref:Large ribosomal subunit protein mL59 domain-containing protein n=1 Tax=Pholiota conissans TaxID=109636 RepID=A0A9P5YY88_9AGAR|nr:hypothetical protein BDN70DRAFT_922249 [Pholiota conissans]
MASVQQRALQSIKAFRHTQLARPASLSETGAPRTKAKGIQRSNPFIPHKHKVSGHWRGATYSLRRQADLAKNAYATNTLQLLPPGPKTDALKLRIQRVKASLTPSLAAALEPRPLEDAVSTLNAKLKELTLATKHPLETLQAQRLALEKRIGELSTDIEQFEVISVVDVSKNSPEYLANERRRAELATAKKDLARNVAQINVITQKVGVAERAVSKAKKTPRYASAHIKWIGKVVKKKTVGSKLGIRLYAGKKRMFKGHLWERQKAGRIRKRSLLMRDMAARVARYKEYYKKRKPNPLKPSRYSKPPKLPY